MPCHLANAMESSESGGYAMTGQVKFSFLNLIPYSEYQL